MDRQRGHDQTAPGALDYANLRLGRTFIWGSLVRNAALASSFSGVGIALFGCYMLFGAFGNVYANEASLGAPMLCGVIALSLSGLGIALGIAGLFFRGPKTKAIVGIVVPVVPLLLVALWYMMTARF